MALILIGIAALDCVLMGLGLWVGMGSLSLSLALGILIIVELIFLSILVDRPPEKPKELSNPADPAGVEPEDLQRLRAKVFGALEELQQVADGAPAELFQLRAQIRTLCEVVRDYVDGTEKVEDFEVGSLWIDALLVELKEQLVYYLSVVRRRAGNRVIDEGASSFECALDQLVVTFRHNLDARNQRIGRDFQLLADGFRQRVAQSGPSVSPALFGRQSD